jgi:hypothetical protein
MWFRGGMTGRTLVCCTTKYSLRPGRTSTVETRGYSQWAHDGRLVAGLPHWKAGCDELAPVSGETLMVMLRALPGQHHIPAFRPERCDQSRPSSRRIGITGPCWTFPLCPGSAVPMIGALRDSMEPPVENVAERATGSKPLMEGKGRRSLGTWQNH